MACASFLSALATTPVRRRFPSRRTAGAPPPPGLAGVPNNPLPGAPLAVPRAATAGRTPAAAGGSNRAISQAVNAISASSHAATPSRASAGKRRSSALPFLKFI